MVVVAPCSRQGATVYLRGSYREPIEEEPLWVQFTLASTLLLARTVDKWIPYCLNYKTNFCSPNQGLGVVTEALRRLLRQDELLVVSKVGSRFAELQSGLAVNVSFFEVASREVTKNKTPLQTTSRANCVVILETFALYLNHIFSCRVSIVRRKHYQ